MSFELLLTCERDGEHDYNYGVGDEPAFQMAENGVADCDEHNYDDGDDINVICYQNCC